MLSTVLVFLAMVIIICLFSKSQFGGNVNNKSYNCDYSRPVSCNLNPNCQYNYSEMKCIAVPYQPSAPMFYNENTTPCQ